MKIQCDKCGKYFEVDGEWGYCPFCENDQVEVKKNLEDLIDEAYDDIDQKAEKKQSMALAYHGNSNHYFQYPEDYEQDLESEVERLQEELVKKDKEITQRLVIQEKDYDEQLEKQMNIHLKHLEEKDKAIENWQTMYQNVMKSCHNSIEEDKRLREQLKEKNADLHQIYSHLGVEAFGEDIQEMALEEIETLNRVAENNKKVALLVSAEHNAKIEKLEKQLAEKEQELEDWEDGTIVEKLWHTQRQLAEKEKEIEKYKELCTISKLEDLQIENMLLKSKKQDKISFCIEQLKKVKDTAENILDDAIKNCSLNESYYDNLLDKIDNQIEELEKGIK